MREISEWLNNLARRHWPAIVLFIITVILQIVFFAHAEPNVFPDSNAYAVLARVGWANQQMAFRTPGYPWFIAFHFWLFGDQAWRTVMATQFVVGTFVPLMLYAMFLPIVRRPGVAAWGGAGFLLDRFTLESQTVPLTEYLGAVLAVASLAAFFWAIPRKSWWSAVATGVLFYTMVIVRPSWQLLPYLLLIGSFLVELLYKDLRPLWRRAAAWYVVLLLSFQLGIWARCLSVYRHTGLFTMSAQLGLSLTNHTGEYMELAPDKWSQIRDIYLHKKRERGGDFINVVDMIDWKTLTGRPIWQVSQEFRELDKYLIFHHFGLYWNQLLRNWNRIWVESPGPVTDYYDPFTKRKGPTSVFLLIINSDLFRIVYMPLEKYLWMNKGLLLKIPYLLIIWAAITVYFRRQSAQAVIATIAVVGTVFYHMILHVAVQGTEFVRYKMPAQAIWFPTLVLMIAWVTTLGVAKARRAIYPEAALEKPRPAYLKGKAAARNRKRQSRLR